uniref:Uncharacterized protein n=1 Tax=Solanum lycopersicum TaxID=4081 RepID=A0A3Q7ESY4_SOLLC
MVPLKLGIIGLHSTTRLDMCLTHLPQCHLFIFLLHFAYHMSSSSKRFKFTQPIKFTKHLTDAWKTG